jgi:hypothetical protein
MRMRLQARVLAGLAVAVGLAACGGGGDRASTTARAGGDLHADAVKLTTQAAGPNRTARSGVVDGKVTLALDGLRGYPEFTTQVSGPYSYRKGAALPDYELELGARDYGVTLTSVGSRSYVSLGSTAYELPAASRRLLVKASAKGHNGLTRTLEQFGIAPWRWETKQQIAGPERIDGVETTCITTGANVGRILRDANTLLAFMTSLGLTRATGLPREIGPGARRVIVHNVTSFAASSCIGIDDNVLRRSRFAMRFRVPASERAKLAGISGGTVNGELDVSEVGRPHPIAKPQTIGDIADFKVGIDAVGDAQDAERTG